MSNYLKKLAYVHDAMRKLEMEKDGAGLIANMTNGRWWPGKNLGRPDPRGGGYSQPTASSPVRVPAPTNQPSGPGPITSTPLTSGTTPTNTVQTPGGPTPKQMEQRNISMQRLTKPKPKPAPRNTGPSSRSDLRSMTEQNPAPVTADLSKARQNDWKRIKAYQDALVQGMVARDGITQEEAINRLKNHEGGNRWYTREGVMNGRYNSRRFRDIADGTRTSANIDWKPGAPDPVPDALGYNPYLSEVPSSGVNPWLGGSASKPSSTTDRKAYFGGTFQRELNPNGKERSGSSNAYYVPYGNIPANAGETNSKGSSKGVPGATTSEAPTPVTAARSPAQPESAASTNNTKSINTPKPVRDFNKNPISLQEAHSLLAPPVSEIPPKPTANIRDMLNDAPNWAGQPSQEDPNEFKMSFDPELERFSLDSGQAIDPSLVQRPVHNPTRRYTVGRQFYMDPTTLDMYDEEPVNINSPDYQDYLDSGDPNSYI